MVELELPMHIYKNTWYENSMSAERGPITYALKIGEDVRKVTNEKDSITYGNSYYEVYPTTPWNYGLKNIAENKVQQQYVFEKKPSMAAYPWNLENAPNFIKTKGRQIPSWQLYNDMTGPIPYSFIDGLETGAEEEIILVPYGCTQLRIAQFPVVEER